MDMNIGKVYKWGESKRWIIISDDWMWQMTESE